MRAQLLSAGPGRYVLRSGPWSFAWSSRRGLRMAGLASLLLACTCIALMAGATWMTPVQLWAAASGNGAPGRALMLEFRLPRVLAGLLAGASLGTAGCLLQAITRNRLATPDLLGLADGAALGIFAAMTAGATAVFGAWWAGPVGAFAAVALLLAACGSLGRQGYRPLVVGLGVSGVLRAVAELVLSRQELAHASALYAWSVGSLNGRTYETVFPLAAGLAVLLPLAWLLSRRLGLLRLDADTATGLGLPLRATQWQALLIAALLAGLAVGMCGPLAFVALAAPFAADRLLRDGHIAIGAAALTGAALVVLADAVGRVLISDAELPVGVICQLLGGPLLLWLLLGGQREQFE